MKLSKRQHYQRTFTVLFLMSVLVPAGILMLNKVFYRNQIVSAIAISMFAIPIFVVCMGFINVLLCYGSIRNARNMNKLVMTIEKNLISIGAYEEKKGKVYVMLPEISIENNVIRIELTNIKIRKQIEKVLHEFSTALNDDLIVDEYYIAPNNKYLVIKTSNLSDYQQETLTVKEYIQKIRGLGQYELYLDKHHVLNLSDYPMILYAGGTGSGKSYAVRQLVLSSIIKGWETYVCDLKGSYGIYEPFITQVTKANEILSFLQTLEMEMEKRYADLQMCFKTNPDVTAMGIGYKPIICVLEEMISLNTLLSLSKDDKKEYDRVLKNLMVKGRQSSIHIVGVMQNPSSNDIDTTIRGQFGCKILLGNNQRNIVSTIYGQDCELPVTNFKFAKGEGYIQMGRITVLRVPAISDIESFPEVMAAEAPQAAEAGVPI